MTRPGGSGRWRVVGASTGWRSWATLGVLIVAGVTWLAWPIWGSTSVPSRADLIAEAPWIVATLVAGLTPLASAIWRDGGRRAETLSALCCLIGLTCVVRAVLSPGGAGVEFVHAFPILAGMAFGAPAGFLVGAGAALASTVLVAVPAETLPAQAVIWGLVGVGGGLLRPLRPTAAWLASLPLAVGAGIGSGVLLNLMGWGLQPGVRGTDFFPGLPPLDLVERLWAYTAQTSLALDATRGVTTALLLLLIGRPILGALRPTPIDRGLTTPPVSAISPDALARRTDRIRLDDLWS